MYVTYDSHAYRLIDTYHTSHMHARAHAHYTATRYTLPAKRSHYTLRHGTTLSQVLTDVDKAGGGSIANN